MAVHRIHFAHASSCFLNQNRFGALVLGAHINDYPRATEDQGTYHSCVPLAMALGWLAKSFGSVGNGPAPHACFGQPTTPPFVFQ